MALSSWLILLTLMGQLAGQKWPDTIRIAAAHMPPFMIKVRGPDGNITFKGNSFANLNYFMGHLNVKYRFVEFEFKDGFINSMINQVVRNEVDINMYGFIRTLERDKLMDFSVPGLINQYHFMVRYPEEGSRIKALTSPFQPKVWLCIAVSLLVVVVSLAFLRKGSWSISFFYVIGTFLTQGGFLPDTRFKIRIVAGTWCLMSTILVYSYAGNVMSYMTVPTLEPIVNSFEDLAAKTQPKITIEANSVMAQQLLSAQSGPYHKLGQFLRTNPDFQTQSPDDIIKNVVDKDAAYLGTSVLTQPRIERDLKATGKCRMTVSKYLPLFQSFSFIYPKGSAFKEPIDQRLLRLWENGFLQRNGKLGAPNIDRCLVGRRRNSASLVQLRLEHFRGAFLILAAGLGLAGLVLVLEIFFSRFQRR